MVCQMATTALLLVHFSDSPLLGGIAVVVWSALCRLGFRMWSWRRRARQLQCLHLWRVWLAGDEGEGQEGWVWRSPQLLALRRGWGIYGINI